MTHIALHFLVLPVVALAFYRRRWLSTTLILVATMLVDADHLLANPVYDSDRCSIGFHPLHAVPFIVFYAVLFALPLLLARRSSGEYGQGMQSVERPHRAARVTHLIGLGLLVHMALDGIDCML